MKVYVLLRYDHANGFRGCGDPSLVAAKVEVYKTRELAEKALAAIQWVDNIVKDIDEDLEYLISENDVLDEIGEYSLTEFDSEDNVIRFEEYKP